MRTNYNKFSPEIYNEQISLTNIIVLLIIILSFSFMFFIFPKETKSIEEKRDLATISPITAETIFSGKTSAEITAYISDHFPLRNYFIAFSDAFENLKGFKIDNVKIHGGPPAPIEPDFEIPSISDIEESSSELPSSSQTSDNLNSSETKSDINSSNNTSEELSSSTIESSENDSSEEEISDEDVFQGGEQQGYTFIYKDRAMGLFGANNKMGEWYASVINKYHEVLGDSVKIYNMVVPTSVDFYIPKKYASVSQPEKPSIDNIYNHLDDGINAINAYNTLEKHKDEYIYFRTDHHWTGLGAYYAYTEFAKSAGFEPIPIEDFTTKRLDNFLGTLYGLTKDTKLRDNPDYVDYYMIDTPYEAYRYMKNAPYSPISTSLHGEYAVSPNSYSVFLHGDFPLIKIKTNINNGKKIAVVKESYGNAFAPFLVNHYEEVYVVDERYFQLGFIDFIKQNGINELLFINNVMAANTPYHIKNMERIMYQTFVPPVVSSTEPEKSSSEISDETSSESSEEVSQESSTPSSKPKKKKPHKSSSIKSSKNTDSDNKSSS